MNIERRFLFAVLALTAVLLTVAQPSARGTQVQSTETLQSEVLISTLSIEDLKKQIAAGGKKIEHKSEVARGEPVTAVVRSTGCLKDEAGRCSISANVTVYRPDGSVFHETKALDLSTMSWVTVPLNIDASAATGLYKVVVNVRDLTARRFGVLERQFAVK